MGNLSGLDHVRSNDRCVVCHFNGEEQLFGSRQNHTEIPNREYQQPAPLRSAHIVGRMSVGNAPRVGVV
jgi:hypothetical protein